MAKSQGDRIRNVTYLWSGLESTVRVAAHELLDDGGIGLTSIVQVLLPNRRIG